MVVLLRRSQIESFGFAARVLPLMNVNSLATASLTTTKSIAT